MNYILIPVLLICMGFVLYSLVRGLIAFIQTTEEDLNNPDSNRGHEMQNKMMFARVKYQALAIAVVAILLMINR